jgi:rod shape-determining protein MreB
MSGLPRTIILSAAEVRIAISDPVNTMVDSVLACLSEAPPELAQDLIEHGIHLVGGGSLLKGLDLRIATESEVPVQLVRQPLESVVLGAGRVVESYEELRDMFMGARR